MPWGPMRIILHVFEVTFPVLLRYGKSSDTAYVASHKEVIKGTLDVFMQWDV